MKKLLILAAAVFALGTSTVSADNDRPISVSELPEKAQQVHPPAFPQRKGLLRQDGARTLRYDLRGDLHQQFQGRIPEIETATGKRSTANIRRFLPRSSLRHRVRFPVLSRYVRRPDRPRQTGLRGEAHQRVGVDVRPEIQPDRHRRLTLSDGVVGRSPANASRPWRNTLRQGRLVRGVQVAGGFVHAFSEYGFGFSAVRPFRRCRPACRPASRRS